MTFTEVVDRIAERLGIPSTATASIARIGRSVNDKHREITTALWGITSRRVTGVEASTSLGSADVTFSGLEKIERVIDDRSGSIVVLDEITYDELRNVNPGTGDPTRYAIKREGASSVTIQLDVLAQSVFTLKADGHGTAATLSGSQEPAYPESFHDILIAGVLADEYLQKEKAGLADREQAKYDSRLADLNFWRAKSIGLEIQQGGAAARGLSTGSSSGSGSAPSGGTSYTQTGLVTFDRDPSAPFAVTSGSDVVPNLDAEFLQGETPATILSDAAAAAVIAQPNVTLAGSPDYLTIVGQVITRALINLASHVTGRLPFANLTAATAVSKLFGRGSAAGAGDFQEITLGTGLTMSGTTLNATGVAGADTQVQFNNNGVLAGDAGLTYNPSTDALTVAGDVIVGGGDLIGSADLTVRRNTSDGADSGRVFVTGGGAVGASRGSYLSVAGNENVEAGGVEIGLGNIAGAVFSIRRSDAATSLSIAGATGVATFTTQSVFTNGLRSSADIVLANNTGLRTNTADGSDNGFIYISGAGAISSADRGSYLEMMGNEGGRPGSVRFGIGNVAGAVWEVLRSSGTEAFKILGSDGTATFTTNSGHFKFLGGDLLVGVSSMPGGTTNGKAFEAANAFAMRSSVTSTSAQGHITFYNGNGAVGDIQTNGSATAFNTSSDARLKNDLGVATSVDVLRNTVVHDFAWKVDDVVDRGVFAQEAVNVIPRAVSVGDAVNGDSRKDRTRKSIKPWSVDYSKYVPDLIVGWQHLEARIAALEAK